jgi:hypothetical protein
LGRANPERAFELTLADSKITAADALKEDFDAREKEFDDFKADLPHIDPSWPTDWQAWSR